MIIGWNGETLPDLPLEQELAVVASVGYDGVELFIPKLASYLESHPVSALAQELRRYGLAALSMNGIENINFRRSDEFKDVLEQCRWLAAVSRDIACPTIVAVPGPRPDGTTWYDVRRETAASLQALADVAADFGIQVAFEFLAPVNCSVRTLAEGWEVVQAAGRPNLGIVLDTYHFCVGGSTMASLASLPMSRLLIVHINDVEDLPFSQLTDGHRLLPGEGVLPLRDLLTELHRRGYAGAYSLEVMRPAYRQRDPNEYARAGLEATRAVLRTAGAFVDAETG